MWHEVFRPCNAMPSAHFCCTSPGPLQNYPIIMFPCGVVQYISLIATLWDEATTRFSPLVYIHAAVRPSVRPSVRSFVHIPSRGPPRQHRPGPTRWLPRSRHYRAFPPAPAHPVPPAATRELTITTPAGRISHCSTARLENLSQDELLQSWAYREVCPQLVRTFF